jgi:hypothetical protein
VAVTRSRRRHGAADSAFFARGGSAGMDPAPAHQARRRKAISGCTRSNSTATGCMRASTVARSDC